MEKKKKVIYRMDSLELEGTLINSIAWLNNVKESLEKAGYAGLTLHYNTDLNTIDIYGFYNETIHKKETKNDV